MGLVHADTVEREAYLKTHGYNVEHIWEHEYDEMVRNDSRFRQFVNQVQLRPALCARDAFFGGRTNCIKLHHAVCGGEQIRYLDVCSEYPYVNKYKRSLFHVDMVVYSN